jgi:Na+-transporting methylmalonyl-CoA/oxaloacetate decarboxylase gamma subunit
VFGFGFINSYEKEVFIMEMDNFTFGITMLVAGMGGTLVTLGLLSLMMAGLGKLFPYKEDEGKEG